MLTAKEKIINAAKKLFSENGVKKTSIRDIAKEAGYSHTTIYLYFKSKQELFNLIAIEPLNILYDDLLKIYMSNRTNEEKLKMICDRYIEFGIEKRTLYPLISTYDGEKIDKDEFDHIINITRIKCLNILQQILDKVLKDKFPKDVKTNLLRGVFFLLHGVISTYISSSEENYILIPRVQKIVGDIIDFTILQNNI
ncbi:TetR/AcrR family transcriptional regulator [Bombilactobacillus bombi]|uniref:TetR/AcrR family transcriptional regulator n=1 Tax=Bombilactobacillus bombi TaxID=1303590 RepID=UPI0015E5FC35|nr:TetR/AcrR family transcriptional regulator [Bombilactobacillus bombi]MBA1435307.1 TetR/AcrR family transcriptional regulator [Bombilactobacillus bombi]